MRLALPLILLTLMAPRSAAQEALGLPRRRYRHYVFTRGGEPCYTCGNEIESITSAGRNLQRCPGCQPV